jgi:Domain of unknown function (DUF6894)
MYGGPPLTRVHFHCSSTEQVLLDYDEADVADMTEAREQGAMMIREFLAAPGPEDWRDWMLHVSDDLGGDLFALPFTAVIGPLH